MPRIARASSLHCLKLKGQEVNKIVQIISGDNKLQTASKCLLAHSKNDSIMGKNKTERPQPNQNLLDHGKALLLTT